MWTIYKAFYIKNGPLEEFNRISKKMGQKFLWKLGHMEDIPWENFHATDIMTALQVYVFEAQSQPPSIESQNKSSKAIKVSTIPKITRGTEFI